MKRSVLSLDKQRVRLYYCIFELEGVIPWCLMHCGNIAIMLFKYTTMATTHARLRIDLILLEYIMERYRLGFGRAGCTLVLVHF